MRSDLLVFINYPCCEATPFFSVEFGVWSFGREDRIDFKNTFIPDCINIAIVLLKQI